jgi:hypothetical protein
MITNTLEIYESSEAIGALITLNIIRCERVGDLDTMPVSVVTSEVMASPQLYQLLISMQLVFIFTVSRCSGVGRYLRVLVCGCWLMGFTTDLTAIEVVIYFHKCAKRRVRQVLC